MSIRHIYCNTVSQTVFFNFISWQYSPDIPTNDLIHKGGVSCSKKTITIQTPIILGEAFNDKTSILDIHIKLNNNSYLNIEMQVLRDPHWTNRSLFYLCRTFSKLKKGENYDKLHPVTHIGFLDFTLFPEYPEFYATYKLLNTKNYHLYSDKLTLNVIDLNHIDLATEEDKAYKLDYWVKIIKATTWEELRMLSQNDVNIEEIVRTLYRCNSEEDIQLQCDLIEGKMYFDELNRREQEQRRAEYEAMLVEKDKIAEENAHLKALLKKHNIEI